MVQQLKDVGGSDFPIGTLIVNMHVTTRRVGQSSGTRWSRFPGSKRRGIIRQNVVL